MPVRAPLSIMQDLAAGSASIEVQQRKASRITAELKLLWEQLLASGHPAASYAHTAASWAGALSEQLRQLPEKKPPRAARRYRRRRGSIT